MTAILFLWLVLLPLAIGLAFERWRACLAMLAGYLMLFDFNSLVVSIGSEPIDQVATALARSDLVIVLVATSSKAVRWIFER